MTLVPSSKVRRAARLLNDDNPRGSTARMAEWTGASSATIKGWQADPTAAHHKSMSATARRLVALLVLLKAKGLLDDNLLRDIRAIEAHMLTGKGRLVQFLSQLTGRSISDEDT